MNEYFYIDKTTNQQCGPFSVSDLKTKNITPDTMVWSSNMTNWTMAGNVPELSVLFGYNQSNPVSPNYGTTQVQPPLQQRSNMYDRNVYGQPRTINDGNNFRDVYPMPKTWFIESLLVTILCCLPFGLAAVLKASKVESLYYAGDFEASEQASKDAKKWTIVGLCSAVAGILIYILFYVVILGAAIGLNDF